MFQVLKLPQLPPPKMQGSLGEVAEDTLQFLCKNYSVLSSYM